MDSLTLCQAIKRKGILQGFSSRAEDGSEGPLDKPTWPANEKVQIQEAKLHPWTNA